MEILGRFRINVFFVAFVTIFLLFGLSGQVHAEQDGFFNYTINFTTTGFGAEITGYTGAGGDVTIPATLGGVAVKSIGNRAFYNCPSLTGITIPNGVSTIGDEAFSCCAALTFINIPDSVRTINNYVFQCCYSLANVTIPNGVTTIGENAFDNCIALENITIPASVTTIGKCAFRVCHALKYINVDVDNLNYSSKDGVLYNKAGTRLVSFPGALSSVNFPEGVTTIGDYAFAACYSITSVTIPNSITTISEGAFSSCISLESVSISNSVTTINDSVFSNCTLLTDITLPNSVTSIGKRAFEGSGLTNVTIPSSVTTIGYRAFMSCRFTSLTIPNGVINIDESAFSSCGLMTKLTIPNSVKTIGPLAFSYCWSLASLTIGNSVETIGDSAFIYSQYLENVVIPESVKSIGENAFFGAVSLKSIQFNSSTTTIQEYPYGNTQNYTIPWSTTIIGYADSTAQKYWVKYGNPHEIIGADTTVSQNTKNIIVKAHDKTTGELKKVPDATVYVYEKDNIPMCIGKETNTDNKIIATGTTDTDGNCTLIPPAGGWPKNATVVACKNEDFKNDGRPLARESYDNIVFTLQAHSLSIGANGEWYGKKMNSLADSTELVLDSPRYLCNLSVMYYYNADSGDYYDDVETMTADLSRQLSESTDGYFAINNIAIYGTKKQNDFKTNGSLASQCDIQIDNLTNFRSKANPYGIDYDNLIYNWSNKLSNGDVVDDKSIKTNARVQLGKKDNLEVDISNSQKYAKMVTHELGHYILGFGDEYMNENGISWDRKDEKTGKIITHPLASISDHGFANFGLMDNQYISTELSTDTTYSYLGSADLTGEIREKVPFQYIHNYLLVESDPRYSCWSYLKKTLSDYNYVKNAIVKQKSALNDNYIAPKPNNLTSSLEDYVLNIYNPNTTHCFGRLFAFYDTNEIISSEVTLPTYSISEDSQSSTELMANIKVITQAAGDQAVISPNRGTPTTLTQMFYDDTASVEIPLTAEGSNFTGTIPVQKERYYLRLVSTLENNETGYSDFVVRSTNDTLQSTYISDDEAVCVSVDSSTADSYNFVSQDSSISRDGYVPLSKAVFITSKDKATVNDSTLLSDVASSTLVDTATIVWYKYENNEWTPQDTQKQDGDYNSITAWCGISGDGYYQLMAQPAKTTSTFQPVQDLTITPNNQYDGSANIAFTDANNKDDIRYYKFYYSDQPFSNNTLNSASVQMFNTYDSGYGYTFEDNTKTYYGAIQIVGKDGSVSDLSEVKSFTTGIRDIDNDGIPDAWIEQYSLRTYENQDTAIVGLDNDSDGLTNQQEYQNSTNPQKKDTDDDGVPDSEELGKGLNPLQIMTDGSTPDYIVAYGSNDFTVENVQMSSGNGTNTLSISLKNLRNTPAKDVNVKLLFDGNVEWFWQADFEAGKTTDLSYVFDGDIPANIQVTIDNEQTRYDVNYSNNLYLLSSTPAESTLNSIAISTPANKLNYIVGESLDITGLTVTGTYSNGSTKTETITTDNITGFDSSKAATDQVLTITVNGKTATYTIQITDQADQMLGDVDNNGKVEAYDALFALQIATGKKTGTPAEIKAADVDKSGTVQAYDALRILQYATGVITAF